VNPISFSSSSFAVLVRKPKGGTLVVVVGERYYTKKKIYIKEEGIKDEEKQIKYLGERDKKRATTSTTNDTKRGGAAFALPGRRNWKPHRVYIPIGTYI
jgi:hypothetical protein